MGLKEFETRRLYMLPELITGTCTLGLPFREVSITLTGREVAVVKAAVKGEGRGDVASSFDSYLCFDEKLVQTLLWEPHSIQPTPETDRDRRIRAHGGLFRDGWLRLLVELAPEGAAYSAVGLATWVSTAELALDLGFDDDATRELLADVAGRLDGKADPDNSLKPRGTSGPGLPENAEEHEADRHEEHGGRASQDDTADVLTPSPDGPEARLVSSWEGEAAGEEPDEQEPDLDPADSAEGGSSPGSPESGGPDDDAGGAP